MLRFIFFLFIINNVSAREVLTSYNYVNNDLLPQGVFTFGYNTGKTQDITNRFNRNGERVTNSQWSSKKLSYNDLVESSKDDIDRVLSSSAFKAFGIDLNSTAGEVNNEINIKSSSEVFVFGYGMTKRTNLFLIIPRVNLNFDITSRFNATDSYNKLIQDLKKSAQAQKVEYLEKIKRNPLKTRLNENGQRLPSDISSISNIYLNLRYKTKNLTSDSFAIIPYGYKYDTRDFLDFKLNDNSLGFKQGLGVDYYKSKAITLGVYGSYHYRSPFKLDYRIPRTENDPMSSDIEKNIDIKYGDQIDFSTQFTYKWNSLLSNYINFRYLYSFKDSYSGSRFSKERYEILENETDSKSLSAQVGMGVNTISSFLAKKFLLPMDFNIQYSKTLFAKNSFDADWISLNLMVFYK